MKQNLFLNGSFPSQLVCPICKAKLFAENNSLYCQGAKKHCFDLAKEGYVHLSPSFKASGDDGEMVKARTSFLEKDYYKKLADTIIELLQKHGKKDGLMIDAGCGEGYYSNLFAENGYQVLGFDLSKPAIAKASSRVAQNKNYQKCGFAVAGINALPIAENSVDVLVNLFAPCFEEEYLRVLKDDGLLVIVGAGKEHLYGLKEAIYQDVRLNEERADLPKNAKLIEKVSLSYDINIDNNADILALFSMTPYVWKTSVEDMNKLKNLNSLTTKVDFSIYIYQKER